MREQLKWYDEKADNSPWLDALAELRQRATREGYCYQHVQAITVAIDQYSLLTLAELDAAAANSATSNRTIVAVISKGSSWPTAPARCARGLHTQKPDSRKVC